MAILYVSRNDVKVRLAGKVRFTSNPDDEEDKMPEQLLSRLIAEAEGDVEQDLSPRFLAPFQGIEGTPFRDLPERPTKEFLRTLVELKAVIRVLETDFGSGGAVDGAKYASMIQSRYTKMKDKILERRSGQYNQWAYPPLPCLRLNPHNAAADDGFMEGIHVTSLGRGDYPSGQINSPGENLWNGELDALDNDLSGVGNSRDRNLNNASKF